MSAPDTAGWTPIVVELPLPLDVASTLMKLIGTAYPTAVVDLRAGCALAMRIDPAERVRPVSKKAAAEAKDYRDPDVPDTALSRVEDEWVSLVPPEELCLHLGSVAHAVFSRTEGAINYVEWEVRTVDDERYVLAISPTKAQLPSQRVAAAEQRIALALEALAWDRPYDARIDAARRELQGDR